MSTGGAQFLEVVSTWAAAIEPVQWLLIVLIVFLVVALAIPAFCESCMEVEELFKHHGCGPEDLS
jgi:hypothetical protein